MSVLREDRIRDAIREAVQAIGQAPPEKVVLQKIPFSGMWGWGSPVCFQLASAERKAGLDVRVDVRSQELAEQLRKHLEAGGEFHRVEAVKGYLNVFFDIAGVAGRLLGSIRGEGVQFGRGEAIDERVMIEYSQPNTHKAFHVGHLRNVCLGHALSNILDFAGFDTVTANYPGDIGLHVIKCLWCYLKYHEGEEPAEQKGRWLGEIYAEADSRLREADAYRERVADFLVSVTREGEGESSAEVRQALAARFSESAERALAAGGDEFRRDFTAFQERAADGLPLEVNELAHRPLGDWLWQVWGEIEEWLDELAGRHPDSVQALLGRYRSVGTHPERWGHAREIKELFGRWEARDPELVALWEKTRQWSLEDFGRIYRQLGVDFEVWFYEHEVEESGKEIVEDLVRAGIAEDLRPSGPVLVHIDEKLGLEEPRYRTLIVLRSDGTSLYSTKDLALARTKFEKYHVDRSIYVVDAGQSLYFQQIFKVLELWGFPQAGKCFHLAYEIVRLPGGKMSSREGSVVFYDDFYGEALRRARESVDSKRSEEQFSDLPDLDESRRREVADAVALGAMKYGMLAVDNNKPILFDFEKALSFEGQTAPYIQYAHARACRILEKGGAAEGQPAGSYEGLEVNDSEVNLLEVLAGFPQQVQRAAREYKPLLIAVYLFELAKSFADFYRDCPVIQAEEGVRAARLGLVDATRQVLANGLGLLGIPAPRYM